MPPRRCRPASTYLFDYYPMLRFAVLLLLLANTLYFAWARGLLEPLGLAPLTQTEPTRKLNQIRPEAIRLQSGNEVRPQEQAALVPPMTPAVTPAKPASECLQSPLLSDSQLQAVRAAAAPLPAGSWALEPLVKPARWIVYMGKYNNPDTLAKKKAELRRLGVEFEPLQSNKLEPGISLGGHDTQAAANKELADVSGRGVISARVVQELPNVKGTMLRLATVDDALRAQLGPLRLALADASLVACKN